MKNSIVLPFLILVLLACNREDKDVIAQVNDYPVSSAELKYWMLLQRAEVHNYFYLKYGVHDSDDFWEQSIHGEIPSEMLKELAFQKAVRCKVQQALALEKGLVKQVGFEQIMLEMQEENLRRKEKLENGEVVYGPQRFTERTFFAHEFDALLMKLKLELSKAELKPSTAELSMLVDHSDFPLKDHYGFYQMQYVEQHYEHFIDSLTAIADIELYEKNWKLVNVDF